MHQKLCVHNIISHESKVGSLKSAAVPALTQDLGLQTPLYAASRPAISILVIFIIASITRFAFIGALPYINLPKAFGIICQVTPNLSVSQPQRSFWPPSDSFSQ